MEWRVSKVLDHQRVDASVDQGRWDVWESERGDPDRVWGRYLERVAAAAVKIDNYSPDQEESAVDYSFGILTETVVAPKKWWSSLFGEPFF